MVLNKRDEVKQIQLVLSVSVFLVVFSYALLTLIRRIGEIQLLNLQGKKHTDNIVKYYAQYQYFKIN